jgi:hypothetical protein
MRRAALLLAVVLAGRSFAQTADQDWLASAAAAEFRARVVQLALIYGDSSGIDPRDFKVLARTASPPDAGCADVEIVTLKGAEVVRRESVRACRQH